MTSDELGGKFFGKVNGKLMFTPLFLVLVLVETTDLLFAVDSIPAAFAITQNEFLIYTSNIFAVMGLRAMFFLLAGIIDKFYLLQKGLSIILFFIGSKMLLEIIPYEISPTLSFTVIIVTLTFSIILSVVVPQKDGGAQQAE
jgi:tellurite resistance protein TerC